ncbi:SUMF1/EgtB/PvdO family nonheme iron enzyme [Candidatus Parabeggiatoa sp. HSG14]|uniref:formylglycine-generating enzyme family protein n=1 Tax=Candidatus Parabeggiatoa sp. HSG14 TaxID=3055593 RepID=UPI0025A84DA3|nr:SUMF1/EgtB/PvdO family nonheme iron enzyme [Thiotrichales bacterium HSG14]
MKKHLGICPNVGNCIMADIKKKVPITRDENFCPACGSELTEDKSANSIFKKIILIFLFFIVVGVSFFIWQQLMTSEEEVTGYSDIQQYPLLQTNTNTPQLVPDEVIEHSSNIEQPFSLQTGIKIPPSIPPEACLLDNKSSHKKSNTQLTIAKIKQMLPMTYVPALKHFPIPPDLNIWMKKIKRISESGFFIMRREVTVGEFKRYFATLSKQQQLKLSDDWQKSRDGSPLPDNYPVGSVSWKVTKDYAKWLSRETGCILSLPTYSQWISATVQYAQSDEAITRQHQQSQFLRPMKRPQEPDKVLDLLGNLREWSLDNGYYNQTCPEEGHYLLGEDYKTWLQYINGEPYCETMALDTVGFRLVRLDKPEL